MITIITPSYNRARLLPHAIESVLAQNYPHIEHVVVDGGSTDHTPGVVTKYPHIRFHSGPDHGMYDALNKGIEQATGEIIGFLNTDDLYEKNIFRYVAGEFADDSIMAVAGHALVLLSYCVERSGDFTRADECRGDDWYNYQDRSRYSC